MRYLIFYAQPVESHLDCLEKWSISGTRYPLNGDENDKTLQRYQEIIDFLMDQGAQKQDTLVAVGGGALLDLIGFVAATFKRGMGLIFVPTTLLAMVDASIGGKNGVNHVSGKNLIGSFYLPQKTYLHFPFLTTLSEAQWAEGYVEMLKIALLDQGNFLEELQFPPTLQMIEKARALKEEIVHADFLEHGKRAWLNFGHTVGHALEKISTYRLSHGEAVAHGMRVESTLLEFHPFYEKLLEKLPFKTVLPIVNREQFKEALLQDKKNVGLDVVIADIFSSEEERFTRAFPVDMVVEAYFQ